MRNSKQLISSIVVALTALCWTGTANAYTTPTTWPADGDYNVVQCGSPVLSNSSDSCTDDARDHRNIVGGNAYQYVQTGDYMFLRMRIEQDPRQSTALVSFGWAFGLDANGDGAFEAYISIIGQGNDDRLEILDQDSSNGTTPNLMKPGGSGTDTSLRPVDTTGTNNTWVQVTNPSGGNFCSDDPDSGDYFVTAAIPLEALNSFGVLGAMATYAGTSSNFTGIQNDFVCATGEPASCSTGATCPTGICLTGVGVCAPPVDPIFLGCVDTVVTGTDQGCEDQAPNCITEGGKRICAACGSDTECNDGNECTEDSCTDHLCVNDSFDEGVTCSTGYCDGAAEDPVCAPCVDDSSGIDTGCDAEDPNCSGDGVSAVCFGCSTNDDCADGNDCTTNTCLAGLCVTMPVLGGVDCNGDTGVCNGDSDAPLCVPCIDDSAGGTDSGCEGDRATCIGTGVDAVCVECIGDDACDDSNDCTTDTCDGRDCVFTSVEQGTVCDAGFCDGAESSPLCVACLDDSSEIDTGCSAGTPFCASTGEGFVCAACTSDDHCDDGNDCTQDACVIGACANDSVTEGELCSAGFCDGASTDPLCIGCIDDGSGTDLGCTGDAPNCIGAGAEAVCAACATNDDCDDGVDCTTDTCSSGVCENTADEVGSTCDGGVCSDTTMCVACLMNSDCASGERCDSDTSTCTDLCSSDDHCDSPTPRCDTDEGSCVQCLVNEDCDAGERCSTTNVCEPADHDGDDVLDETDLDDDNDGVLDSQELGGTDLSGDSDADGVDDYRDADFVTCTDDNTDGACDELPSEIDFDRDGVPNHYDLDSDGDSLTDLRETDGPSDENFDGLIDAFTDENDDGLDDRVSTSERELPNTDRTEGPDFLDVDSDDDGVDDLTESNDEDRDGEPDHMSTGADTNDNGVDDGHEGANHPTEPDTDGDGAPDWRDADDDNDGIPTADEDTNGDGDLRNDDADGDGVPDYLEESPAQLLGYSGGAGCGVAQRSDTSSFAWVALALAAVFIRRRSAATR